MQKTASFFHAPVFIIINIVVAVNSRQIANCEFESLKVQSSDSVEGNIINDQRPFKEGVLCVG
jgi:hypothetical protein